jgi:hypothetical protein
MELLAGNRQTWCLEIFEISPERLWLCLESRSCLVGCVMVICQGEGLAILMVVVVMLWKLDDP